MTGDVPESSLPPDAPLPEPRIPPAVVVPQPAAKPAGAGPVTPSGGSPIPPESLDPEKDKPHSNTMWIVAAVIAAVVFALAAPRLPIPRGALESAVAVLKLGGEVFLHLLKMVVVPLVMSSVMSGILNLGDIRKLGRPGLAVAIFFVCTLLTAVTLGVVMTNIINPGKDFPPEMVSDARAARDKREAAKAAQAETPEAAADKPIGEATTEAAGQATGDAAAPKPSLGDAKEPQANEPNINMILRNIVLMLFTDSVLKSMAEGQLLPLISFCIVFAGLLTTMGARAKPIADFVISLNQALMAFVMLVMRVAPLGIFCLVAGRFTEAEIKMADQGGFIRELQPVAWYFLTVLSGLAVHGVIVLPLCVYFLTGRNPVTFIIQISDSLLTAFSTASSNATIPVTMECCVEKAGISKKATEFVVPLGATVNMDGTALYEAAAAMFLAQAIGISLSLDQQFIVGATAALAAIGASGIPEAGLVTMVIVLDAVGLPKELISVILPVDWLLDRFRTAVNVLGDSVGSAFVDQYFEKDDLQIPVGAETGEPGAPLEAITPVTSSEPS